MNGPLAARYATALADVAIEQNQADAIKTGLGSFVQVFFESEDLRNFLETPGLDPQTKRRAIEKIAERMDLPAAVRNFLWVIVDHRRTEMLREIQAAFHDELNARLGIAEAEVVSARPLSDLRENSLTSLKSAVVLRISIRTLPIPDAYTRRCVCALRRVSRVAVTANITTR